MLNAKYRTTESQNRRTAGAVFIAVCAERPHGGRVRMLLKTLLWLGEATLAGMVGYLLLLTGAAISEPRRTPARGRAPDRRFLFLVPAHNEERLLPALLQSLDDLDYPRALYAVHVVADNCS